MNQNQVVALVEVFWEVISVSAMLFNCSEFPGKLLMPQEYVLSVRQEHINMQDGSTQVLTVSLPWVNSSGAAFNENKHTTEEVVCEFSEAWE